ncbi:hypothetical protein BJY16_004972 [Actinoplanes octamycinicus]|uniref:Uncharacterized protein n=1 Tax=Actinoplanes octamycinicus TaxID=135948 RepID=A0A7W7M905_9ACTN|nr:hypothetical protein [Actinoplanes octamycinicus]MBB4741513.1 hypothetical protein [Actinoplanes octamycinicus]GIE57063.1 hypothetical protein Aoc01nite_24650 [Actinoplanes octamycinicus]
MIISGGRDGIGSPDTAIREPTIFFFEGERAGLSKPRTPLAGFWSLSVGAGLLTYLTMVLQPATTVRGCSNYGGNGNGTPFSDGIWDLVYLLLLLLWSTAVIVEQLLPVTWNGRRAGPILARALLAVTAVVVASCSVELKLLVLCH